MKIIKKLNVMHIISIFSQGNISLINKITIESN